MALGGLISFSANAFVMFSSLLAKAFNNNASLGVLPKFSIEHRNRQKIRGLEETVETMLEVLSFSKHRHTTDMKVVDRDNTATTSFKKVSTANFNTIPSTPAQTFSEESKVRGQKNAWVTLEQDKMNEPEVPSYKE